MQLLGKHVSDLRWPDIERLVAEQVSESNTLDFKRDLPGGTDSARGEFLADVAAFANASGGVLVYGVSEARSKGGDKLDYAGEIVGLDSTTASAARQRLQQVIQSGLDPPLHNYSVLQVESAPSGTCVLVIGVGSSVLGPHAVAAGRALPVWVRVGTAKTSLRMTELRRRLLAQDSWEHQVMAFRDKRAGLRFKLGGSSPIVQGAALLIHVLPLGRLDVWTDLLPHWDLVAGVFTRNQRMLSGRLNFDGILRFTTGTTQCDDYIQWFRCGGFEFWSRSAVDHGSDGDIDGTEPGILTVEYAHRGMEFMARTLEVSPPYAVGVSFLDVAKRRISTRRSGLRTRIGQGNLHAIEEVNLIMPLTVFEVVPESIDATAKVLKPLLDAWWQASGLDRCWLYDQAGEWRGRTIAGWESCI